MYIITSSGPEGTDSRAARYEKQLKASRLISNRRPATMSRPAYMNEKYNNENEKKKNRKTGERKHKRPTKPRARRWQVQHARILYYYIMC